MSEEKSTFERINFKELVPAAYRAMLGLETYVHQTGLEESLLELVKIRASQINGCAYCLDMHSKGARACRANRAAIVCSFSVARGSRITSPPES